MIKKSKINNQKLKIPGFTLMEVLVSMGVFAIVSTIIITVLFTTFRTSKKSEVVINLKQNGDAAMSQMVREIMYAESLDDPPICTTPVVQDTITVTSSSDGGQTTYSCPTVASPVIASNGASLIDSSSIEASNCSFTCSQNSYNDPPTITIQYSLINVDNNKLNDNEAMMDFRTSVSMRNFSR